MPETTALHRAANEMQEEIKKYGIHIDFEARKVGWKHEAMDVPVYTSRAQCRTIIRKYIKAAKLKEKWNDSEEGERLYRKLL